MPTRPVNQRVTTRRASALSRTHALSLLRADHKEVGRLSREYESLIRRRARPAIRLALARRICHQLDVHARIEEEILYPALRKITTDALTLNHADVEHEVAKSLIRRIERSRGSESHFDALVGVLCEYVSHHVKEEETEIFPKARASGIDLWAMGALMSRRRSTLQRQRVR